MAFLWKEIYKISNVEIDSQHREIFKKANLFLNAIDKASLTLSAMEFFKHTREHFNYEESLMLEISYPERVTHVQQHNELIKRLNDVAASIASDSLNRKDLELFLKEWLLNHIRIDDTKLSAFISNE